MVTLPPISSYPLVTPVVTKPRQLAPTVGLVSKGVTITGEAQRNMQHLAIGRVLINLQGEQIMDDSGWSPELDLVETGGLGVFISQPLRGRKISYYERHCNQTLGLKTRRDCNPPS